MLGLYGAGRQADALSAYRRARAVLVEELGLEPGPALVELQDRILRHELPAVSGHGQPGFLPAPMTSFIGRESELAALPELIDGSRLVTLVGVGGAGKTRLALEAASRWRSSHGAAAWFVDLAPLRDPGLVATAVMGAIGAAERPGVDPLQVIAERLESRRTLLLLDNCEHLIDACARVTVALLEACPRLLVIATSRTPLLLAGEAVYAVPPLATPDATTPRWRPELPAGYEAVRLFTERARAARADTVDADVELVADLCRRLDGLPLAIEFAAARTRSMSVAEIVAGMDDRFKLLGQARRAGPERHRTLRAAIDWSHDLLAPEERVLLARLSVFDGGFTVAAADAVCAHELTAVVPDLLAGLLDASLITAEPAAEQTRYRLYETVREYAADRLVASGEHALLMERHARYYGAFAEQASGGLLTPTEQIWLRRLDAEDDNLRAALRWAAAEGTGDAALLAGIAVALASYWRLRGSLEEPIAWLCAALDAVAGGSVEQTALRILLGSIRVRRGEFDKAAALLDAAIRSARLDDERELLALGLHWLAGVRAREGRPADAVTLAEQALTIREALGDAVGAGWSAGLLGDIAIIEGRYADALPLAQRALLAIRDHGPPSQLAGALHTMALLAHGTGDLETAEALSQEAFPIAEQIGDVWHLGLLHLLLGWIFRARGNTAKASAHALLALERFDDLHTIDDVADTVELLAGCALDSGQTRHGCLLLAGSRHIRQMFGMPAQGTGLEAITAADWATAQQRCGAELEAIERRAAGLTFEQLIAAAREQPQG
jgi:predicted ATPase